MHGTANLTAVKEKIEQHLRFWARQGPSLLLSSPDKAPLYETRDYARRFADPQLMWETEMRRAEVLLDWPTDGIPTVRPNLGVVFLPSLAGQGCEVADQQMPWPGQPLGRSAAAAARKANVATAELMRRAERFYQIHHEQGGTEVAAYHPDTQGVFDVSHLLCGDEIFLALAGDPAEQREVLDLLDACLDLYVRATRRIKQCLGEADQTMIHGHGTAQGVLFPDAGVRLSEDTATLLSPAALDRFVMPCLERAAVPFGAAFVHYCGWHQPFFAKLCSADRVRAIDLGNPEKYDVAWLLERCAATETILYSRLPPLPSESPLAYVQRLGALVRLTGARVILRATVTPRSCSEAAEMLAAWHELTTITESKCNYEKTEHV